MNAQLNSIYSLAESPSLNSDATALSSLSTSFTPELSPALDLQASLPRSSSLLFIDQRVEAYQVLAAAVTPGTEVHILDTAQDAIAQITQALLGRSNIASLHIISHGSAGLLELGTSNLSLANLPTYASQIQSWATALANDADILLYGCEVAQGDLGQAFVQILSQLTQADVAASSDITGFNGNWVLEFQHGQIETTLPFTASTLRTYQGNLIGSDFDDNGTADLVQYNYYDGTVNLQLMTGTTPTTYNLGVTGYGWQLMGIADFDGNNYMDLVWQNPGTGDTGLWLMNGTNILAPVGLPNVGAGSDWQIVGIGDFDLNNTPDLLWRSKTYEVTGIWLMGGTNLIGVQGLPSRSGDWVVSGVQDFNNDGSVDILWRNPLSGANEIWCMNGLNVGNQINLTPQASPWVIHEIGNWNGDAFADILWRNASTGQTSIWTLNAGNHVGTFAVGAPTGAWTILDSRDLDANGTPDLIARNYLTGENAFWMMNETNYNSTVNSDTIAGMWDIIAA